MRSTVCNYWLLAESSIQYFWQIQPQTNTESNLTFDSGQYGITITIKYMRPEVNFILPFLTFHGKTTVLGAKLKLSFLFHTNLSEKSLYLPNKNNLTHQILSQLQYHLLFFPSIQPNTQKYFQELVD